MFSCKKVAELAPRNQDGKLSWKERFSFKFHVKMCKACKIYSRQMARTKKLLGCLSVPSTSDGECDKILARIRREKEGN